jgi:two-component system response regulator FixJ
MASDGTVFVVDDNADIRHSLRALLESAGFSTRNFDSAKKVLSDPALSRAGCLITDVRMPDMNGLELQRELVNRGINVPVIVITGHSDVPLAVRAMKAGAVDFIEKPFDADVLLDSVRRSLALAMEAQSRAAMTQAAEQRIARLTRREREVLEHLVAGRPNKIIAYALNISPRTVDIYRAQVMSKMHAPNLADLVRQVLAAGMSPNAS